MNHYNEQTTTHEINTFTLQDLVDMVLRKWYWFVLSVIFFMGIGALYILSTPPVYHREATIMVKDSRKGSGANEMAIFGEIAGLSTRRNVDNELFVLQARRLMTQTINELGLTTNYSIRKRLRQSDLYKCSPIEATFVNAPEDLSCAFKVKLGEQNYTIYELVLPKDKNIDCEEFTITAEYGTTVVTPTGEIIISKSPYMDDSYVGKEISVTKYTAQALTTRYCKAMVSAVANKMSSIINISLNDVVARRAEDIINTLIRVYNDDAVNDKREIAEATANFIDARLEIISKELGAVDDDIEQFKSRHNIVDIAAETEKNFNVTTRLQSELISVESQLEMSRFIKDYLSNPEKEYSLIPITGFGSSAVTQSIAVRIAEYNELVLRREKLLKNSSANNPVVEQLNSQRVALKNAILASLDSHISTLDIQHKTLIREQEKTTARIGSVPKQEQEYLTIARQQRIKEELYLYLLNKREENAITLAITENTARIIDSAYGSSRPVSPRKSIIMLFMMAIGAVLPLAIIYLRQVIDTSVRSRKDIERFTTIPYLGDIPVFTGKKHSRGIVVRENGRDNISEAFRILRANMGFMNTSGNQKVILITSSTEHSGKTFVATNLAMVNAFSGNKVLLIDLDLRRRMLTKQLGHRTNPNGVSKYMSDHTLTAAQIISKSDIHDNIDCIYAGLQPPNPAEQLLSPRLDALIEECKTIYDCIIIDSVPAMVIADAMIASRVADLSLYVIREGMLDKRQLPDVEKLHQQNKLRNMCIVLNGASEQNHRYGYSYTYNTDDDFVYSSWEKFLCSIGLRGWVNRRKASR